MRTFGIEEEFLLVDPASGVPQPAGAGMRSLRLGGRMSSELQLEQVETCTRAHSSLSELAADVQRSRVIADTAARRAGARIAALATSPLPVTPTGTPGRRYDAITAHAGLTAREQLTNGCHVHVSIASEEEGVAVLDRIRIWLPVLTALTTNSPFWEGQDTGYAGFRSQVWGRWPTTGPNEIFGSTAAYRRRVRDLLDTGVPLDEAMVYFDARLSSHHPTVEIRVADVCLHAGDAALLAALVRALVDTASRRWEAGETPEPVPAAVLAMAAWRASRFGLTGDLLHPVTGKPCPAQDAVHALMEHVRPALSEAGDESMAQNLLGELLTRGTGAQQQRGILDATGNLSDVVAAAVTLTTGSEVRAPSHD